MEPVTRPETLAAIRAMLDANKLPVDDLSEPGVELFCNVRATSPSPPLAWNDAEHPGCCGLLWCWMRNAGRGSPKVLSQRSRLKPAKRACLASIC